MASITIKNQTTNIEYDILLGTTTATDLGAAPALGVNDNYVTDAQVLALHGVNDVNSSATPIAHVSEDLVTVHGGIVGTGDSRLTDARPPTSHALTTHADWPGTLTTIELGYVDGVTSSIQTQLNGKQASGTYSTDIHSNIVALNAVSGTNTGNDAVNSSSAAAIHAHGNIANGGTVGTAANLPLITTTGGAITAGSFGSTVNSFCQGNDVRLSDSRTPTAHAASHVATGSDPVTTNHWHGVVSRTTVSPLPTSLAATTFTLACATTPLQYYYKGVLVTVNTNKTATMVVGKNYIYFTDAAGTLATGTSFPDMFSTVLVSVVSWNGTLGLVEDERHNHTRDIDWHSATHQGIGTRYVSGGAFSYAGTTNATTTFSLLRAQVNDEDIKFVDVVDWTTARIFYQTAADTYAWLTSLDTRPYWGAAAAGGGIYAVNATTYAQLTVTQSNRYFNYFVYHSTDVLNPVYILAESTTVTTGHTSAANARAISPPNIGATNLTNELKLMYRIVVNGAGLIQTPIAADDYRTGGSIPGGGVASTSHNTLTNLELAGVGVTYGHIDDQAQTIAGAKTFTDGANGMTALASVASPMDGTAAVGTSTTVARQDHVHNSDTSRALLGGSSTQAFATAALTATGEINTTILSITGTLTVTNGANTGAFAANSFFTQYETANYLRSYICGSDASTRPVWEIYTAFSAGTPALVATISSTGLAVTGNVSASEGVKSGTWTITTTAGPDTIATLTTGVWQVYQTTFDAANYGGFATIIVAQGSARIVASNAISCAFTLSGLTLQVTFGAVVPVTFTYLKIA